MNHPIELIQVSGSYPDLTITDHGGWGFRHEAFLSLLDDMFKKYESRFANMRLAFNFYSGDRAESALKFLHNGKVFANNTTRKLKEMVIPVPDFLYSHGREVGIAEWEETIKKCKTASLKPYAHGQCFWIGDPNNHASRIRLLKLSRKFPQYIKALPMEWKYNKPDSNMTTKDGIEAATNFIPIHDHADYKYLIDIPGIGYSSRLKLLFHLRRPVFIAERSYEEFFYPHMEPDRHYIPVKKNLSDLVRKIRQLEMDPERYEWMVNETETFAATYLSKEFALDHLCRVVMKYGRIDQ